MLDIRKYVWKLRTLSYKMLLEPSHYHYYFQNYIPQNFSSCLIIVIVFF